MSVELDQIVHDFNWISIKDYAHRKGEDYKTYSEQKCLEIIQTHPSCITPGAIYLWPRENGTKIHIMGFGLKQLGEDVWFLAGFNSKKLGRPKVEKIDAVLALKMIMSGEVEYVGQIFDLEFRKTYDMERLSLAVIGLASMVMTFQLQKDVSVEHIVSQLETGEMSIEKLLDKCKMATGEWLL